MDSSMPPKCGYAGLTRTLGPSSGLQKMQLRTHLRNFKKVYRSNKLGRSDFNKFTAKTSKKRNKGRHPELLRRPRPKPQICYQSLIRSRNLKKLQLINEEAYHRVCNKIRINSGTSSSVAASLTLEKDSQRPVKGSDTQELQLPDDQDSIFEGELPIGAPASDCGRFRKTSYSSTANSLTGQCVPRPSRFLKNMTLSQVRANMRSPDRSTCSKSKKNKSSHFSLDKAAKPVIKKTCKSMFKSPSLDALDIFQDCHSSIFILEKDKPQKANHFKLVNNIRCIF